MTSGHHTKEHSSRKHIKQQSLVTDSLVDIFKTNFKSIFFLNLEAAKIFKSLKGLDLFHQWFYFYCYLNLTKCIKNI